MTYYGDPSSNDDASYLGSYCPILGVTALTSVVNWYLPPEALTSLSCVELLLRLVDSVLDVISYVLDATLWDPTDVLAVVA